MKLAGVFGEASESIAKDEGLKLCNGTAEI
jgi:hypothetical protein